MKIGVLALQGDFQEHCKVLEGLGVECVEVRLPGHLAGLDGLIIPGGESTTIGKLAVTFGLIEPIRLLAKSRPVWGTCGGLVLMAKDVGMDQPILGLADMVVQRNAFGRQVDSFEAELQIEGIPGGPFHGVFIRAPIIKEVAPNVETMCRLQDGRIVAARQGWLMVTAFHPELTGDDRVHRYFLEMVAQASKESAGN
jgi:pyridoxal 5'-phosphate synthase pdxT subunit